MASEDQERQSHQPGEHPGEPAPHPDQVSPIRRYRTVAIVALLAIVIVIVAMAFGWGGSESTTDAQVDAHIASVSSRVSGYVTAIHVDDNQDVPLGFLAVELDSADNEAAASSARATYESSIAEAEQARRNVLYTVGTTQSSTEGAAASEGSSQEDLRRAQVSFLQTATASLMAARATANARHSTAERTQKDLERNKRLLATGDISKQQYDQLVDSATVARQEAENADQQVASAERNVEISKAQVDGMQFQVARSRAQVRENKASELQIPVREAAYRSSLATARKSKATLDSAMLTLSYTKVFAPIAGRVTQRTVELGQYVAPGQLLFTLVPMQQIYVTANFKETQLEHMREGQRASITADAYPGHRWRGHVGSLAGATGSKQALLPPQNATGNFVKVVQRLPVKILLDRSDQDGLVLRPGMNVRATVYVQ